jgi:hypothetical protein
LGMEGELAGAVAVPVPVQARAVAVPVPVQARGPGSSY